MKYSPIFVVFFVFFTSATIVIPVPLFPGNMIQTWLSAPLTSFATYISAIVNGITYGLATWIIYVLASKRIENRISEEPVGEEEKPTP